MCDFIFTKKAQPEGRLSSKLKLIFKQHPKEYYELHGSWGSVGFVKNHYDGYESYENEKHILIVIGGPILNINLSVPAKGNNRTKAIYEYWQENKHDWSNDLSGPFLLLLIDKTTAEVRLVSDMLGLIPFYHNNSCDELILSTHVDIAAAVGGCFELDHVSIADFIRFSTVCFPYTIYKQFIVGNPASIYLFFKEIKSSYYYLPKEEFRFKNIEAAAACLRNAFQTIVNNICSGHNEVGVFISGGEDSRILSSAINPQIKKVGWTYVDKPNRELALAKKIAKILEINHIVGFREDDHYFQHLEGSTALSGATSEMIHAHTFGFIKLHNIVGNQIIIGGLLSDALIKGSRIVCSKIKKLRGLITYNELRKDNAYEHPMFSSDSKIIKKAVLETIIDRRKERLTKIQKMRPKSFDEWFNLWPSVMLNSAANFYVNRRLFSSYEPFAHNELLKILDAIPQEWKINRRFFHLAFKDLLVKTWYVPHSKGHYPYFSYKTNFLLQFIERQKRKYLEEKIPHQGSWPKIEDLVSSVTMMQLVDEYEKKFHRISSVFQCNYKDSFNIEVPAAQQLRVLQLLVSFKVFSDGGKKQKFHLKNE